MSAKKDKKAKFVRDFFELWMCKNGAGCFLEKNDEMIDGVLVEKYLSNTTQSKWVIFKEAQHLLIDKFNLVDFNATKITKFKRRVD